MTVALKSNALTTLAACKSAWGIDVTTYDDLIIRAINSASDRIERYCSRHFGYTQVVDEAHAGKGGKYLTLDRTPLISITEITHDGITIDSSNYEINDAAAGLIASVYGGWMWDCDNIANIGRDPFPGSERKLYAVSYTGGYVLPKDAVAATVTGENSETFTFGTGEDLVITTERGAITVPTGDESDLTAVEVVALINVAVVNDDLIASASDGVVVVSHTGSDADNTLQVTDNAAATVLGLSTVAVAGTRTLPWDIEDAAISLAFILYKHRKEELGIKSERMLSYSVTYMDPQAGSHGIPDTIAYQLSSYRRLF
jgi:hypothetical protein